MVLRYALVGRPKYIIQAFDVIDDKKGSYPEKWVRSFWYIWELKQFNFILTSGYVELLLKLYVTLLLGLNAGDINILTHHFQGVVEFPIRRYIKTFVQLS